jgi:hypothetical protein
MSAAGVFLIQRLEGSRLGRLTLWVLNGGVDGEGWGAEESIARSHLIRSSRQTVSKSYRHVAGDAGTRVAMMLGQVLTW